MTLAVKSLAQLLVRSIGTQVGGHLVPIGTSLLVPAVAATALTLPPSLVERIAAPVLEAVTERAASSPLAPPNVQAPIAHRPASQTFDAPAAGLLLWRLPDRQPGPIAQLSEPELAPPTTEPTSEPLPDGPTLDLPAVTSGEPAGADDPTNPPVEPLLSTEPASPTSEIPAATEPTAPASDDLVVVVDETDEEAPAGDLEAEPGVPTAGDDLGGEPPVPNPAPAQPADGADDEPAAGEPASDPESTPDARDEPAGEVDSPAVDTSDDQEGAEDAAGDDTRGDETSGDGTRGDETPRVDDGDVAGDPGNDDGNDSEDGADEDNGSDGGDNDSGSEDGDVDTSDGEDGVAEADPSDDSDPRNGRCVRPHEAVSTPGRPWWTYGMCRRNQHGHWLWIWLTERLDELQQGRDEHR